jgi:hypothetical protein
LPWTLVNCPGSGIGCSVREKENLRIILALAEVLDPEKTGNGLFRRVNEPDLPRTGNRFENSNNRATISSG